MGWTFTHKDRDTTVRQFFEKEFHDPTIKILDVATVGFRECYIAMERKGEVFALVCLLDYRPDDYYNFGYKDMDETMAPYYYNCPERILKILTSTTNEDAITWRGKCWSRIEKNKARPKLKHGDIIKFANPITFVSGTTKDTFKVKKIGRRIRFVDATL